MEYESEVFIILLAREDDNGDTIHVGDWEAAFHTIRGDLERRSDIVVALAKQIVLEIGAYSVVYEVRGVTYSVLHIPSYSDVNLEKAVDLPGRASTRGRISSTIRQIHSAREQVDMNMGSPGCLRTHVQIEGLVPCYCRHSSSGGYPKQTV